MRDRIFLKKPTKSSGSRCCILRFYARQLVHWLSVGPNCLTPTTDVEIDGYPILLITVAGKICTSGGMGLTAGDIVGWIECTRPVEYGLVLSVSVHFQMGSSAEIESFLLTLSPDQTVLHFHRMCWPGSPDRVGRILSPAGDRRNLNFHPVYRDDGCTI